MNYGLGTEDTPIFPRMHEASALLVGGTLTAVDAVMTGQSLHALNLGGGLHHGFRGKASGFCIYNDSSVAIKYLQKNMGHVSYMSILMHIMATESNGHFMMIRMYAPYPFMKRDATYFPAQAILTKGVKEQDTAIHSTSRLMHSRKMAPGSNAIQFPLKRSLNSSNRMSF